MKTIHCKTLFPVVFSVLAVFVASSCSTSRKTEESKRYSDRDRASLLVTAAMAAMKEGDPIGALEHLKRAEEIDPKFSAIYHARTQAFLMRKDEKRALESIEKALRLSPEDSGVNNTAGKLFLDAGRYAEAQKALKQAADDPLFRESYKAKTSLGILHYRKNEIDLADRYFRRANDDNPSLSCIAYYYRGHIAMKRGKLMDAQKQYERASGKICANFAEAHYALGMALERSKNFDQARKKYLEVRQVFPESPFAEQAILRLKNLP